MPATRPWAPIEPLDPAVVPDGRIAALDALRDQWEQQLERAPEEDRRLRRQRSLRLLAIETGIIERLYDIDWGVTLTLAAEGFSREVVERANGKVDSSTLLTLSSQKEALELVLDFVRDERKLTPGFIKELHHAMTRTQATYEARDALGNPVERELPHGTWKRWPNHVVRADGSLLEYCPPEHVDSEMDHLTIWYEELERDRVHPLIAAAWLHHRFVQIHPFADGNGRVARGLTLLALQRHRYAPLVVDRFKRDAYLAALDRANDGDLRPLLSLFAKLEQAALVRELETAVELAPGSSTKVAHTLAAQLAARRAKEHQQQQTVLLVRAQAIEGMIRQWLEGKEREIRAIFREQGLSDLRARLTSGTSWSDPRVAGERPRHQWFRHEVIQSARRVGHFADFSGPVAMSCLRLSVEELRLTFVASLHGAGRDSGVLAVTTYSSLRVGSRDGADDELVIDLPNDAFLAVGTEPIEAITDRYHELHEQLDDALAIAMAEFVQQV